MSKFADAAYKWMHARNENDVSSDDLWAGLREAVPDLTETSERRKTPRTTCMRDLRKDERFTVGNRRVSLSRR